MHHGPGLNSGLSWLGARAGPSPEWVWVLDSDCVVARADVLDHALPGRSAKCPAIIGELAWDRWHQRELMGLHSLIVDPARVWRPPVQPFTGGGDPAFELLTSTEQSGFEAAPFPFTADGYVIHRGRGSLAAVVTNDDRDNPLFGWAVEHHDAHFGGVPGAQARYDEIVEMFEHEVGTVSGAALASACLARR